MCYNYLISFCCFRFPFPQRFSSKIPHRIFQITLLPLIILDFKSCFFLFQQFLIPFIIQNASESLVYPELEQSINIWVADATTKCIGGGCCNCCWPPRHIVKTFQRRISPTKCESQFKSIAEIDMSIIHEFICLCVCVCVKFVCIFVKLISKEIPRKDYE